MTDYTITTDFGAKDSLPSGNAAKVIKGSEFTTEFTNIKTAVNSKADTAGDTFTGAVTFDAAVTLNADVTFDTNTLFVDVSENKVGIGNVAPATALDVTGTVTASGLTVDTDTLHVDATNDRVGVGTTSPSRTLHIKDAIAGIRLEDSDGTSYGEILYNEGSNGLLIRSDENNADSGSNIIFEVDGSESARIDSSGNVGIGTTSPDSLLEVVGADPILTVRDTETGLASTNATLRLAESGAGDTLGNYWDINYTSNSALRILSNTTERMRIDSSGNVGIGTTSPLHKVDITGDESTTYDATNDSGQSNHDATLQIFNKNATDESFASLVFRNRTSGVGISRISSISKGSGTTDMAFVTENSNVKSEKLRIKADGNVGIGTTSPTGDLTIGRNGNASGGNIMLGSTTNATNKYAVITSQSYNSSTDTEGFAAIATQGISGTNLVTIGGGIGEVDSATQLRFYTSSATGTRTGSERMRIDSSGNLLVGKTSGGALGTAGIELRPNNLYVTSTSSVPIYANRNTNDGEIIQLRKDGSTVGSIGTVTNRLHIGSGNTFITFYNDGNAIYPAQSNGTLRDNAIDIGTSSGRFDDIYATNGTIQTSDRNEKQDIAELSDAEQRVAVAAKGLLRKFRWRDAVEEKGDEARIHFGIIAQDLQDAFTAEGLNAGDYAMFINSTWTDEETGEERSRMGVRYSELLAFIISAI